MAERRMFAKSIVDSDMFLDMPMSARLLYYDLGMRADDDGFVNSPKRTMKLTGASDDDMKLLITKQFVIPFESGVVVIKHWKIHNYIQKDRYKETIHLEEKRMLTTTENKEYSVMDTEYIQNGNIMDAQVRIGKDSIGEDSLDQVRLEKTIEPPKLTNEGLIEGLNPQDRLAEMRKHIKEVNEQWKGRV